MKGAAVVALLVGGCLHSHQVAPPAPSAVAVDMDDSGVPFSPAPEGLLQPRAIEAIQRRLGAHGLMAATPRSGRLDPSTREALRRFQVEQGLPATGLPSYRTIEALKLPRNEIFFSARRPPQAASTSADERSASSRTTP
jgi:peptidoglycan hydrolase-like protein with peptidoglycan-binding domain